MDSAGAEPGPDADDHRVVALVGVYHARGSLSGEVAYAVGKLLGRTHCGLCDVTHSPLRRRPAWDALVARLGVPVELLHLDERPADVATATAGTGTPVVLARLASGGLVEVLDAAALDAVGGSVEAFEQALRTSLASRRLRVSARARRGEG